MVVRHLAGVVFYLPQINTERRGALMQPAKTSNELEEKQQKEGFKWKFLLLLLPVSLILLLISSSLMAFTSRQMSAFTNIFLMQATVVYGGGLVYILLFWITKPIRDLSYDNREKLLEIFAGIVARLIMLFIIGLIAWFIYKFFAGH
ncbi:hypothetical protein EON76_00310 [bacterium]|nr:MAG: hypothetical protein EON76_00310 [bacterium]